MVEPIEAEGVDPRGEPGVGQQAPGPGQVVRPGVLRQEGDQHPVDQLGGSRVSPHGADDCLDLGRGGDRRGDRPRRRGGDRWRRLAAIRGDGEVGQGDGILARHDERLDPHDERPRLVGADGRLATRPHGDPAHREPALAIGPDLAENSSRGGEIRPAVESDLHPIIRPRPAFPVDDPARHPRRRADDGRPLRCPGRERGEPGQRAIVAPGIGHERLLSPLADEPPLGVGPRFEASGVTHPDRFDDRVGHRAVAARPPLDHPPGERGRPCGLAKLAGLGQVDVARLSRRVRAGDDEILVVGLAPRDPESVFPRAGAELVPARRIGRRESRQYILCSGIALARRVRIVQLDRAV